MFGSSPFSGAAFAARIVTAAASVNSAAIAVTETRDVASAIAGPVPTNSAATASVEARDIASAFAGPVNGAAVAVTEARDVALAKAGGEIAESGGGGIIWRQPKRGDEKRETFAEQLARTRAAIEAATAPTKAIEAAIPPPTPAAPVAPRYDAKAALAAASRIIQADAAVIAADIAGERMRAALVDDMAADISGNATRARAALQAAIMQADEDDIEALLMAL